MLLGEVSLLEMDKFGMCSSYSQTAFITNIDLNNQRNSYVARDVFFLKFFLKTTVH